MQLLKNVESEIKKCNECLNDEKQKFEKYKVSQSTRSGQGHVAK